MKKFTLFFVLVFFISMVSYGQSGWQWFNPYPTGQTITSMSFTNANTGMAVTDYGGTILWTTNGGNNWTSFKPFNNILYSSCLLLNENTGFAGEVSDYSPVHIIRTTNKGENWEVVLNTGLYNIEISSIVHWENNIYTSGGNKLIKSTNGGENWTMNSLDIYSTDFGLVKFINENTGFICGNPNVVAKTTNGGINWLSIFQDSVLYGFWSALFKDENTGFVFSYLRNSLRTTNGGLNWVLFLAQPESGAGDCNGNNIVIKDYYSTNFGLTWTYSINDGYAQKFADSNTCYSYRNDDQTIWKSTNKGVNWLKISNNTLVNTRDLTYCSRNIIYSLTSNTILKSTNSGYNFVQKLYNNQYYFHVFEFTDSLKGAVTGSDGWVLTTTNGGNNWVSSKIGNYNFIKISVKDDKIVLLDSATTNVYVSTNFGNTWNLVNISSEPGRLMKFVNYNVGYILNYNKKLYKTTNGGFNWTLLTSTISAYDLDFYNENTGILNGITKYNRTFDGGLSWDTLLYPTYFNSMCIKYTGLSTLYTSGVGGRIFKSTNSGLNWIEQNAYPFINMQIYKFAFFDSLNGFAIGGGNILRTYTGGEINVGVKEINTLLPDKFYLHQNYPNPFNYCSNITFEIKKFGYAKIMVYDVLGREIRTLVNESLKPGTYEITFDGSEFPSGVYFYRLTTGEFSETKKMLMVK